MITRIPVEISARHVHLSSNDVFALFGKSYTLTPERQLSQPGQFLAKERVEIVGPKNKYANVAIIGPERDETQVEISRSDSLYLGLPNVPVRLSGDISESIGGLTLVGPKGRIKLKKGVIVPKRHLHASSEEAVNLGIKHGQIISIEIKGPRAAILKEVVVRANNYQHKLAIHLDTDEANAVGIKTGDTANIIF